MRILLRLAFALALLPGCPGSSTTDAGTDTPSAMDVPSTTDVPSTDDVPSTSDVPAAADAPVLADTPAADVTERDVPGTACDGLSAGNCLAAGCVPVFDDSCCPTCEPGPCADCTNIDWLGCRPASESPCAGGCGVAPEWVCTTAEPDCSTAHVVDQDSCDRPGCIPSFPSGEGTPDIATASCTPITADSCRVTCRRLPPTCPTGTYAEGDGSCYTERCIPNFYCLMR